MASKSVEKSLSSVHALLGETPEAAAAVDILRDLVEARERNPLRTYIPPTEADQVYCLDRIALAVEKALHKQYALGWEHASERSEDEDDASDDMDGDHASALESVYGPDNDEEG